MLIGTWAISGLPPFSAFFSKDEILWKAFATENLAISWWPYLIWGMGTLAALFTSFYMYRLYYMTFSGENRADRIPVSSHHGHDDHHGHHEIKESPKSVTIPLMILAGLAAVAGFIGMPHLFHALPNFLEHWLEPVFEVSTEHIHLKHGMAHAVGLEWILMSISVFLAVVGWLTAKRLYNRNPLVEDDPNNIPAKLKRKFAYIHEILFQKYFVDELYHFFIVANLLRLNNALAWFDGRIIDGIVNTSAMVVKLFAFFNGAIDKYIVDGMVKGVGNTIFTLNKRVSALQTGRIQTYVIGMSAGLVLIIIVRYILL
jgi:NADH-quinone oxidoreductase subunit L